MKKEKIIFWLSIIIVLVVFSGFPVEWRKYVILFSSLLITILSYLIIKEKGKENDFQQKEREGEKERKKEENIKNYKETTE